MAPLAPIVTAALPTVLGAGISAATANKSKLRALPKPEPVTPMPVADSAEQAAAKKRSIQKQLGRRGRTSTILSDTTSNRLGG